MGSDPIYPQMNPDPIYYIVFNSVIFHDGRYKQVRVRIDVYENKSFSVRTISPVFYGRKI